MLFRVQSYLTFGWKGIHFGLDKARRLSSLELRVKQRINFFLSAPFWPSEKVKPRVLKCLTVRSSVIKLVSSSNRTVSAIKTTKLTVRLHTDTQYCGPIATAFAIFGKVLCKSCPRIYLMLCTQSRALTLLVSFEQAILANSHANSRYPRHILLDIFSRILWDRQSVLGRVDQPRQQDSSSIGSQRLSKAPLDARARSISELTRKYGLRSTLKMQFDIESLWFRIPSQFASLNSDRLYRRREN